MAMSIFLLIALDDVDFSGVARNDEQLLASVWQLSMTSFKNDFSLISSRRK